MDTIFSKLKKRSLNSALFNLANSYNQASEMVKANIFSLKNADLAAPAIMCQSFSIELLLKFFIVINYPNVESKSELDTLGVSLSGHKYSNLYDRISLVYRKKIAESFSLITQRVVNEKEFRTTLLEIGDDPFVYWRYTYERDGGSNLDVVLLNKVTDALGKAAETERKKLTT